MSFLRSLSSALSRLADHQQGQDVERRDDALAHRRGRDHAALMNARGAYGVGPVGLGR